MNAKISTPRTDGLLARIYMESAAAQSDLPGCSGHDWQVEEAYEAMTVLARELEAQRDELLAALQSCADRLEACATAGGSDQTYAQLAVKAYRDLIAKAEA